jgi:hypothetical protein
MPKSIGSIALAFLLLPTVGAAQGARLDLPAFPSLADKAVESVNIDIGPWLLHAAARFVDDKDADSQQAKRLLTQLDSVRVRSYQFASDHTYPESEIESVRKQLSQPGWNRLVQTHERDGNKDVDIYVFMVDSRTQGLAVISRDPREFVIVNITGSINLEDLPTVEQELHLPRSSRDGKDGSKDDVVQVVRR